jgi:hypothetical protein
VISFVSMQRDIFPHCRDFYPANNAREFVPIYKPKLEWPFDGTSLQGVAVCRMPATTASEVVHGLPIQQRFALRKLDKTTTPVPYGGKPSFRTGLPMHPMLLPTAFFDGRNADIAHERLCRVKSGSIFTKGC